MGEQAARWVRVSSGNQDEANQLPRIDSHGERCGYDYVETFTVHDASASKGEHEAVLMDAIAGMAAGNYSVIVARHSDRIDRQERLREWMMLAAQAGGRFEFVDEPGLTLSDDLGSKIGVVVSAHNNAEYSRKLAHNVKDAHNARRARGSVTTRVGWGYSIWCTQCDRWSEGRPECRQHVKVPAPTDMGRAYVKDVYARALAGQSLRSIAAWLSSETGQRVTEYGVRSILGNPMYTGRHTYADGRVCECEALITADMQEQARKALSARLRRGQRGSKAESALLIPTCLDCGGKAYRSRTGSTYSYYCRTCRHTVLCAKLDSIVMATVLLLSDYEDETETIWVEGSDSASERAEIRRAMRELDPDDDDYLDKATALRDALRALPEAVPGHFEERPTGRSKAEAIYEVRDDRNALRGLLATWGVAFARDGDRVRVKVNGSPEFWRSLTA